MLRRRFDRLLHHDRAQCEVGEHGPRRPFAQLGHELLGLPAGGFGQSLAGFSDDAINVIVLEGDPAWQNTWRRMFRERGSEMIVPA